MRSVLPVFIFCLIMLGGISPVVAAESPEMQRLLREREILVKDYTYFNAQNSNFWGKKSKKDLLQVIETLKGIIKKDSEIIQQMSVQVVRTEAALAVKEPKMDLQTVNQQHALQDRVHQLNEELLSHTNLAKARQRQIAELQEEIKESRQSRYTRDRLLLGVTAFLTLLSGYLFYTRRPRIHRKRRRKTAS